MGPRVSLVRLGGGGRWKPSSPLTPLLLLHQGPRGLQGPPGPPGKLGRRVSAVGFNCSPPQNALPCCHAQPGVPQACPLTPWGGTEPFAPSSPPSRRVALEQTVPGDSRGTPDPRCLGCQDAHGPFAYGEGAVGSSCAPQGDRGFDGLPGLPGEKGHRVSAAAPRPPPAATRPGVPSPPLRPVG